MSEEFRDLLVEQLVTMTSFDFDTAELCVTEFFDRFMEIKKACHDADNKRVFPSQKIDMVWRYALMNTNLYSEFCNDFCGKFFHYKPQPLVDEFQLRAIVVKYSDTLKAYSLMFGKPNEKIWPPLTNEQTTFIIDHSAWVRRIPGYNKSNEEKDSDVEDDEVSVTEEEEEQLTKKKRSGMCIYVKFFSNRCLELVAESSDVINELAVQLFEMEKIPIESQYFVFEERVLQPNRTFADYNIQKNSVLEMRLRLRGC